VQVPVRRYEDYYTKYEIQIAVSKCFAEYIFHNSCPVQVLTDHQSKENDAWKNSEQIAGRNRLVKGWVKCIVSVAAVVVWLIRQY
jgi:hypothetical protein